MRRLFVHIGTHKTGSSSIQAFLAAHESELAGQGVIVPTSGVLDAFPGHHNIAWESYGDPRFKPSFGGLADAIEELDRAGASRAVLSAEDFEFLVAAPEALGRFHAAIRAAGWRPTYVVLFRRPEAYAMSLYSTLRGRRKIGRNFLAFLRGLLAEGSVRIGPEFYDFNRDRFQRGWRAVTGEDSLVLLDFDASLRDGGPVVALLKALGLTEPVLLARARDAKVENRGRRRYRIYRFLAWASRVGAAVERAGHA